MPVGSEGSAREAAARGITIGVLEHRLGAHPGDLRGLSRQRRARPAARCRRDKLAYMALIGVGDTREEGWRRADQILGYSRTSGIVAPQFMNPPGYVSPEVSAQMLKAGGAAGAARDPRPDQGRPPHRTRAR